MMTSGVVQGLVLVGLGVSEDSLGLKDGNGSQWSVLGPPGGIRKCWEMPNVSQALPPSRLSHVLVITYPGNAVPLQLSDNCIRRVSGTFRNNGIYSG